ncbi:MAG: bL17 family ribosomal protein, partial [Clostridia bacterium]|nr:bL17 family ribosomal protein [Clostridia bacterium]
MERKLGLNATQRIALLKNQASALLWYGKIETTEARAKALASYVSK